MSYDYGSRTNTPPRVITPEEIQRKEMEEAIRRAMEEARRQYLNEVGILRDLHNKEKGELQAAISKLRSQYADTILQHQQQLQRLRDQCDQNLQSAMKAAEQKRQQDRILIEKELNDAINAVNANIDDLRQDTANALEIVTQNINQLQTNTAKALENQQQQINNIVAQIQGDKDRARQTKNALMAAYQEQLGIVNIKNHQKYAPGQLNAIQARLNGIDALSDEAACAILNTNFNDLLTLDANIEKAKMEYEAKHLITLKAAEDVLARMHENRKTISLTDGNNEPLKDDKGEIVKLELDFWTEGEYGELEKELEDTKKQITDGLNDPKYTSDDLDKALDRIMQINQRQMELVVSSIEKGNASQIRAEMADAIVEHLEGQRFEVIERGYENNDARNAYVIKFDDGTSKIIVIINPESNTVNHVVIGTVETDLSEPDLIEQGREINAVLEEAGIGTDGGVCNPRDATVEDALKSMYDIDIIKQNIPKETKERARLRDIRRERKNKNNNK